MRFTTTHRPLNSRPSVLLVGDAGHAELRDAVSLLRETSFLTVEDCGEGAGADLAQSAQLPELIVLAKSRPGTVRDRVLRKLEQHAPLAGVVSLLGSWCEGQARTGRPSGVRQLYWYEFPRWWAHQLARRRAGRCPDWARPEGATSEERGASKSGLILLSTPNWESYSALTDGLTQQGFATAWQQPGRRTLTLRGVTAGIWEGGQLDDREAGQLAAFCDQLARDGAPVVALLDFPRRDRCQRALEAGAAAVLGKPWLSADLVGAIEQVTSSQGTADRDAVAVRAA